MTARVLRRAALALALFGGVVTTATAQTAPNPSQVYIQRLTYAGSGCPAGTVTHNVAPDAKAFTILFSNYAAQVGPGVPLGKDKTSCRVTVDLRFPNGWSYSIFTVDYRGYMSLQPSVSATQKSTYYFQSTPSLANTMSSTYWGPVDDDFQDRDSIPLSDLNWSPCGRTRAMNIDTELSVNNSLNRNNSGIVTLDSMDGQLAHVYGIMWQRCL